MKPAEIAVAPPRVLGRMYGDALGPTLLCVAGMHGNEPAGIRALERVFAALRAAPEGLVGHLVGLAGNRGALAQGRRFLARDLNRMWKPEELHRLRAPSLARALADPEAPEDTEQRELDLEIRRTLAEPRPTPTYLLDLHTTSGRGPAFAVLDDSLRNRAFAMEFPVPIVLGLEEELPGTLLYYLAGEGLTTLGFEAGQNEDPRAVERAVAAIWIALEASGVLARGRRLEVAAARRLLAEDSRAFPHFVEVLYRHPIDPGDRFRMTPGFTSFDPVRAGQPLAEDRRGLITAAFTGRILMPLYQEQGSDGYFLVRPVRTFWLHLSALLRRLRLHRHLAVLPGIQRHPVTAETYIVDARVALWLVRELFHLLGYRREANREGKLVFRRRAHE